MSGGEPVVSVVMPTYNGEAFLDESIISVQRQSFKNWELLIIDDCSHDTTVKIAQEIAAQDPRIVMLRNETNCGPLVSRNSAMRHARGRFIAFLDQDDVWMPNKLELQTNMMLDNNYGVTFTGWRRMAADGTRQGRLINAPKVYAYKDLHRNTGVALSSCMIDTTIVGAPRFADTRPYTEYEFYESMFSLGIIAHGLQADLLRYRVGSGALSYNKFRMAAMVWNNLRNKAKMPFFYAAHCFCLYAVRATLRVVDSMSQPRN